MRGALGSARSLKLALVGATFACLAVGFLIYSELKKDADVAAFASMYVGQPFRDLVAQIGEPGVSWRTQEEIERQYGRAQPGSIIHVYSGGYSLICVVVDEHGTIRQVRQRGSP